MNAIAIDKPRFAYGNNAPVLDIADWQVPQGSRIFLRGPSGSGKSTLLNLLSRTLVVAKGLRFLNPA